MFRTPDSSSAPTTTHRGLSRRHLLMAALPLAGATLLAPRLVRADQPAGDYADPGDFKQPSGTQAYEWTGAPASTPRPVRTDTPGTAPGAANARKPAASGHQH